MKKLLLIIFITFSASGALIAQERGALVVNKFRHVPLLLNVYSSLMNNTVESVVSAAYSTRRVNLFYNGPLIRVRVKKSSTWYEFDIGFTEANELDTNDLLTSVGAREAHIVKWYDQSGNARDAVPSSATDETIMPKITNASGIIYRKGTLKRPAVSFITKSQALFYYTSTNAQVLNAVRDLIANNYQYLFSMPANTDYSLRANGDYSATTGSGGYSDGPNTDDWWNGSGSMLVNGSAISGATSGAVNALHTLTAAAPTVRTGTFSISNNYTGGGGFGNRGMENGDGVCELNVFPSNAGMTTTILTAIQANQKAFYGTP